MIPMRTPTALLSTLDPVAVATAAVAFGVLALGLLGLWIAARIRLRAALRDRTAAERERLDLEVAVAEQAAKLRILRELHEVASASVSAVATRAAGVRYTAAEPEAATRAIDQVAEQARLALADLRRVTRLVREGDTDPALETPPGLASIDELVALMRESGLSVELEQAGEPLELREGAELAVIRILQRALENALHFGGEGTTAKVTLRWTHDGLQLLVDDDGTRAAARRDGLDPNRAAQQRPYSQEDDLAALTRRHSGAGITEMRERAEVFGGVFTVSEVPGVGFSISVVFPALQRHNGIHGVKLDGA